MSAVRSECAASTALILSQILFFASADGAWPRITSLPPSTCTLLTCTLFWYIASSTDWYFFLRVASCWASPVPAAAPPSSFLSKIPIVSSLFRYTPRSAGVAEGGVSLVERPVPIVAGCHAGALRREPRAAAPRQAPRPRLPRGVGGRALPLDRGPLPGAAGGPRLPRHRPLLAAARLLGPGPGQHDRDPARPVEGRPALQPLQRDAQAHARHAGGRGRGGGGPAGRGHAHLHLRLHHEPRDGGGGGAGQGGGRPRPAQPHRRRHRAGHHARSRVSLLRGPLSDAHAPRPDHGRDGALDERAASAQRRALVRVARRPHGGLGPRAPTGTHWASCS